MERIEDLRARSIRVVRIRFDHEVPVEEFSGLVGVREALVDGRSLELRTSGEIDPILKQAALHHVVDFVSEQADMEHIFLAYYSGRQG